jgi:hypothetical protein
MYLRKICMMLLILASALGIVCPDPNKANKERKREMERENEKWARPKVEDASYNEYSRLWRFEQMKGAGREPRAYSEASSSKPRTDKSSSKES